MLTEKMFHRRLASYMDGKTSAKTFWRWFFTVVDRDDESRSDELRRKCNCVTLAMYEYEPRFGMTESDLRNRITFLLEQNVERIKATINEAEEAPETAPVAGSPCVGDNCPVPAKKPPQIANLGGPRCVTACSMCGKLLPAGSFITHVCED